MKRISSKSVVKPKQKSAVVVKNTKAATKAKQVTKQKVHSRDIDDDNSFTCEPCGEATPQWTSSGRPIIKPVLLGADYGEEENK